MEKPKSLKSPPAPTRFARLAARLNACLATRRAKRARQAKALARRGLRWAGKIKFLIFIFACLKGIFFVWKFFKKDKKNRRRVLKVFKGNASIFSDLKNNIIGYFKNPSTLGPKIKKKLKDFLVPHLENDHTPRALRPRALIFYAALALLGQLILTSYLFATYPTVLSAFTTIEKEIFGLVNTARVQEGIGDLKIDSELQSAAQAKADDMIINDYFSHFGPDGKKPWDWIDYEKYSYSIAGENLGKDFLTASGVHRALMASDTHRKNILNPRYQDMGIGIAAGKIDGADTLVLVQMFGARAPVSPVLADIESSKDVEAKIAEVEKELFEVEKPTILAQVDQEDLFLNLNQIQSQNFETTISQTKTRDSIQAFMYYLDRSMFVLVGFLILALLLNIFIQIRVQKPKTIASTLLVIGLIFILVFSNFHFLEGLARVISIK